VTYLPYLPDPAERDRAQNYLRVFVLLPTTKLTGGVLSVVNAANILIERGHQVVLGAMNGQPRGMLYPRTEPILCRDPSDMPELLRGRFDIVMATSWETVDHVQVLAESTGATQCYYVQDFEPDFYSNDERRDRARETYDLIPNRIVTTGYLQERLVEEGGWSSQRIRPGMDLDTFYPRPNVGATSERVVLGMARSDPEVDRGGLYTLKAVFEELHRQRPGLRLRVFGPGEASLFDCPVEALGRVEPAKLAHVYSAATVFVETSRSQGFGRTGAEAFACGTACVLSDSGGITEYARDGHNCVVVPVGDVGAAVEAVLSLVDDPLRRDRFSMAGREAVERFSDRAAADDLIDVLRRFLDSG
jgi:glycosyltransferase involved in cell wall biosynthesis